MALGLSRQTDPSLAGRHIEATMIMLLCMHAPPLIAAHGSIRFVLCRCCGGEQVGFGMVLVH
jgi:hypothetical protein